MAISIAKARAAKKVAKDELAEISGVSGIGLTKVGDDYALKVNLRAPLPGSVSVPEQIAGVPVRFEVVGPIRKRAQ
jgi:hypothetical protein